MYLDEPIYQYIKEGKDSLCHSRMALASVASEVRPAAPKIVQLSSPDLAHELNFTLLFVYHVAFCSIIAE